MYDRTSDEQRELTSLSTNFISRLLNSRQTMRLEKRLKLDWKDGRQDGRVLKSQLYVYALNSSNLFCRNSPTFRLTGWIASLARLSTSTILHCSRRAQGEYCDQLCMFPFADFGLLRFNRKLSLSAFSLRSLTIRTRSSMLSLLYVFDMLHLQENYSDTLAPTARSTSRNFRRYSGSRYPRNAIRRQEQLDIRSFRTRGPSNRIQLGRMENQDAR